MRLQQLPCGMHDAPLLARHDARGRAAVGPVAARAHLDDDQHLVVQRDEVEFAASPAEIAQQDPQAARLEPARRELLRDRAARAAAVAAVLSVRRRP